MAFTLLHICGGFCKLVHLACTTPPLQTTKAFQIFDEDVHKCFAQCTAVDTSDHAWHQARLSLSRGGLGLRSLAQHSPATYIASLCTSGFGPQSQHHLVSANQMFNSFIPPSEAINAKAILLTPVTRKSLSFELDDYLFKVLLDMSSIADKARLLSVSSPHAGSWLSVTPSEGLGLHLDPSQFQVLSSGGLAWTFPMVHAAHCALRLPGIHLAIMLLPAKGVVMWFPATTNCVISLRSPAGELIWVSRWKWVTISSITATRVQLTF